ncbi:hypothetical protein V6617_18575 (plasmid) [Pelagibacterium nitratireducens]|jgi:hypothetical protein|uniref:Uncharacterized protein n=1 Tax=Pelagibacterium nitratireducens TaxID=1046114 RepID=A0ABZ2I538_9HYPH|tara:strand:+ start:169 stop:459 length:291 start_codon:yes stop_codon:yes gene_type:complete
MTFSRPTGVISECEESSLSDAGERSDQFDGPNVDASRRLLDGYGNLTQKCGSHGTDRLGGNEIVVLVHLDAIVLVEKYPARRGKTNEPAFGTLRAS